MTIIEQGLDSNPPLPTGHVDQASSQVRIPDKFFLNPLRISENTHISITDAVIIAERAEKLCDIHTFNEFDRDAFLLCVRAHDGKRRVVSHDPYAIHPIDVAVRLASAGRGDMVPAALLHDVIEDDDKEIYTNNSLSELLKGHNQSDVKQTLLLVEAVTTPSAASGEKRNTPWIKYKMKALEKVLSDRNPDARLLKTADLLTNALDTYTDWHREDALGNKLRDKSFSPFSAGKESILERYVSTLKRLYHFTMETGETNILLEDLYLQILALLKIPGMNTNHPEWQEELIFLREEAQATQELGATP